MNKHLETVTIKLTCLGPVHVGSGDKLTKLQYIYDTKQRRAYFLNETAWIGLLSQKRLLSSFSDRIAAGSISDLYRWCTDNWITPAEIERVASGWATVAPAIERDSRLLNSITPLMRGADGRPYIPGSSIKGALRTAILHHLLTSNTLSAINKHAYWQQLGDLVRTRHMSDKDKLKKIEKLTAQIESDLLHRLELFDENNKKVPAKDAVTSVMKGIRVSDAFCTAPKAPPTCLLRKVDWQDAPGGRDPENYIALVRECFTPGTTLTFTLTVEPALTRAIGIASPADVLAAARSHAAHMLNIEKAAFGQRLGSLFSRMASANLILGGGSGFLDKTLLYSLATVNEARALTAALLDLRFAKHRHVQRDSRLAPRTLKLGIYNNERYLMGVCKLEQLP
ncbi:CRISPR-associated RAMP protein, Csm5 family [Thermosinus carboxydivorans Nor1]|uniref:CRISPR system Cms protein Csm5 n=1 Tax=Thermosinus carboxydivorans Nor1 TaxID=401526 RepID=A1HM60_9FIRM|nr:type III-A CRISPR-associated RAMP protein Csm5 [Thermosinus carboxydivorans]EAX48909.1 CRISPR-associated RAMP protein, Csm5 family [Thermosinus carboxydivorans Nor1]